VLFETKSFNLDYLWFAFALLAFEAGAFDAGFAAFAAELAAFAAVLAAFAIVFAAV
jgi:hypothetical protein